jgi:predicted RNase H-like nuclease (RuvC/YqgF family)
MSMSGEKPWKRYLRRFLLKIFRRWKRKFIAPLSCTRRPKKRATTAERDAKRLREQLEEREEENEAMRRELVQLRKDREDIRGRVEKMLSQMEALTREQAAS